MRQNIEVSTTVRATLDHVHDVLADDPGGIIADHVSPEDRHARTFRTELDVEIGEGSTVSQEVEATLGLLHADDEVVSLPVDWRATHTERLFPVFEGELTARRGPDGTELTLTGVYDIPLGPVGRFGDTVLGRRLARQSLSDFVHRIASRLDHEVDRRTRNRPTSPTPYNVDYREYIHPGRA